MKTARNTIWLLRLLQRYTASGKERMCGLNDSFGAHSLRSFVPLCGTQDDKQKQAALRPPKVVTDSNCFRNRKAVLNADRKSTRLNSSHTVISYAVFCLKK